MSFLSAVMLLCPPSIASSSADNDFERAQKLFDTGLKDMDRSKAKFSSGKLSYIPTLSDGKVHSFKVLSSKKKLLNISQPDEFGTYLWVVRPLTGLARNKTSFEKKQNPNRAEWDIVGDTFKSMQSPFVDLNADGKLEIVVGSFSGGAHCCSTYKIYSLDKPNKLLDTINGRDAHFVFADIDGDKKYEAIGSDMTFGYWNTSFAGSPSPAVILRLNSNGKYTLATDLMRTKKWSVESFRKMVAQSKSALDTASKDYEPDQGATLNLAPELWKNMLELIYSGHSQDAWALIYQAWPEGKKALFMSNPDDQNSFGPGGPDEFIGSLLAQLKKSPYWKGLKKLNSTDGRLTLADTSAKSKRRILVGPAECKK